VANEVVPGTTPATARPSLDNLFTLIGLGDGTFGNPTPYEAGPMAQGTNPAPPPTWLAVVSDPLIRVTTFTTGGTIVTTNFIRNGDLESKDLSGEKGNLDGWNTVNMDNSHGNWMPQKGNLSPLSLKNVQGPVQGSFAAMLDQDTIKPLNDMSQPSVDADFAGSHLLYQDIFIPANATSVKLRLSLYLRNFASDWSQDSTEPSLDYKVADANQK